MSPLRLFSSLISGVMAIPPETIRHSHHHTLTAHIYMHILVIPSFLPPYGGSFAIEQAKALHAIGNHVGIIHCQQHGLTVYPRLWLSSCSTPRHEEAAEGIMMLSCGMRGMPRMTHLNQRRH